MSPNRQGRITCMNRLIGSSLVPRCLQARSCIVCLLVVLLPAVFNGQTPSGPTPQVEQGCAAFQSRFPGIRCPNAGCGETYTTYMSEACNIDNGAFCTDFQPQFFCCNHFVINVPNGVCLFTKMREPRVRSRILELSKKNTILVPTCTGAYIPATVAFKSAEEKNNDGL